MGCVQHSATDEGSGGAVLFPLKAALLHHRAERETGERGETCMRHAIKRIQQCNRIRFG